MSIIIEPMPRPIEAHLIERLARCETGTIGHFEHQGFLNGNLRPVTPGVRVAGTAITLRTPSILASPMAYLLSVARPGDFIVVDRCGESKHANWGYVTSYAARLIGIAGIIIDGPSTDLQEQREQGIPCWCSGASPITVKGDQPIDGAINVPVSVGGVAINPGDAVLADDSGIFVCSPQRLVEISDEALSRQAREQVTLERLARGESLLEIFGLAPAIAAALGESR
ncbi:RraA family protein [Pseudomonas sp. LRF_L74]|uniref:RraA family protein n=1 Tax=Pseudomonas sp. LRF_L74 TaxID=3369422 RepID=UPI003F63D4F9